MKQPLSYVHPNAKVAKNVVIGFGIEGSVGGALHAWAHIAAPTLQRQTERGVDAVRTACSGNTNLRSTTPAWWPLVVRRSCQYLVKGHQKRLL